MLRKQKWFQTAPNFQVELMQCESEGKDISHFHQEIQTLKSMDPNSAEAEHLARHLILEFEEISASTDATEPYDFAEIKSLQKKSAITLPAYSLTEEELLDRVYGAWLGRCAGCLLGKPVETWPIEKIESYLKDTDNYPITDYMSGDLSEEKRTQYGITDPKWQWASLRENIQFMPEDDDTNYTVLGLKILELYGLNFTTMDIASVWLSHLPILSTCTAERVAYINLCNRVYPPETAIRYNPYREFIGAQIRADIFGYIAPGNPALAAELAYRDAALTHVKNGIYGEMFVAAMLAAAFVTDNLLDIVNVGLSQIPQSSRLYESIQWVVDWYNQGIDENKALEKLHHLYDENHSFGFTHTIPNAMLVVMSLLYGALDFEKSIGYSVMAGFDTDCNGATVGSIVGLILGAQKLPDKWIAPMNDTLHSAVAGYQVASISTLAKNTVKIIHQYDTFHK